MSGSDGLPLLIKIAHLDRDLEVLISNDLKCNAQVLAAATLLELVCFQCGIGLGLKLKSRSVDGHVGYYHDGAELCELHDGAELCELLAKLSKSEKTIKLSYYNNDDCVEDIVDLYSLGSVENETDDSFNDELKPEENKGVENDPALWPLIFEQKEKEEIIKIGPSTLSDDFPRDASNNRAFPKVQREYLIWSPSSNSLFCFFVSCSLFGCENSGSNGDRSLLLRWNGGIRNDWRKLSDRIKSHHSNPNFYDIHLTNVEIIVFGQYSSMEKNEKGNFLSCLELVSRHNKTLKNHLETVACHQNKGTRMQAHYFFWQSQNEFISECATLVQEAVVKEVKDAVYFTIITNGTPDVSHTEQITFILRFVRFNSGKMIWEVKERFLCVEDMEKKKGADIAYLICNVLAKVNLDLQKLRGQGYDNCSNVAGIYNGAQAHILEKNPFALYIPCGAHSLNLAGVHAAESCAKIKTFFGNIQAHYVFFSCHTARGKILLEKTALSLHKLSDTRWSAHIAPVKPLVKKPREIIAALDRTVNQLDLTADMLNQAKLFGKYFKSFESVFLLTIWYKTLQNIDCVSRCLQSESITIEEEVILIQQLLDDLGRIRSSWNCILTEAKLVAGNLGFDIEFKVKRTRRVKKFHEEPSNTAHYLDNTEKNFEVSSQFSFICLQSEDPSSQNDKPRQLSKFYSNDVKEDDLVEEFFHFDRLKASSLFNRGNSLNLLNQIYSKGLQPIFPSICILLRIFHTIPISVAEGERSFSKLKIIKNHFRATMGQERLSNLMMLSIENDLAKSLSYDETNSQDEGRYYIGLTEKTFKDRLYKHNNSFRYESGSSSN
ncbi:zinc finger MYM-type protein 1-like [Hydra vulgaris]|uniref:Zinc finger MYM-type protein 1-like n=1 Tax=Hydra vulgaris TaxID=6087 RepID=A0ABM4BV44_HYDVU